MENSSEVRQVIEGHNANAVRWYAAATPERLTRQEKLAGLIRP